MCIVGGQRKPKLDCKTKIKPRKITSNTAACLLARLFGLYKIEGGESGKKMSITS